MADLCVGCGKTDIHPFEGLVRSIMDGSLYHVYCKPPLQSLQGECEACEWHIMHRVIPEHCPRCGRPTRVMALGGGQDEHTVARVDRGGFHR